MMFLYFLGGILFLIVSFMVAIKLLPKGHAPPDLGDTWDDEIKSMKLKNITYIKNHRGMNH